MTSAIVRERGLSRVPTAIFLELRKFSRVPKIINGGPRGACERRRRGAIAQVAALERSKEEREEGRKEGREKENVPTISFNYLSLATRVAQNFIRFREIVARCRSVSIASRDSDELRQSIMMRGWSFKYVLFS